MIEEISRSSGPLGSCSRILLMKSLADKLWSPFKIVVFNSVTSLILLVVVYLLFCVIYLPLFLISFLVSSYGSIFLLLALIVTGLRSLARTLVFPGSSKALQREVAQEFLRKLCVQLESVSKIVNNMTTNLLQVYLGNVTFQDVSIDQRVVNDLLAMPNSLLKLSDWIEKSIERLGSKICKSEIGSMNTFKDAMVDVATCISALSPYVTPSIIRSNIFPTDQALGLERIQACKAAAESLKNICTAVKPSKGNEEGGGFLPALKSVAKMNGNISGFEKLSFALMKEQLRGVFQAEFVTLSGNNGNTIDIAIVPATSANNTNINARPANTENRNIVLMCNPNAGYYESLSQCNRDTSWLGFYTSRGWDVCLFNYRGYSESTGVPTPHAIKSDGEILGRYLRSQRPGGKLLVHGESIGGMVACHIASRPDVKADMLVVDRSFAALDCLAGRLLGGWAALGLRWLALWTTDVVSDYLNTRCPKIILQVCIANECSSILPRS